MTRIRIPALLVTLPLVASCFVFQCGPYNCPQAREGRALYAPLLASIGQYREKYAVYPETLGDLTPEFIDGVPTATDAAGPKFAGYRRVNDRFEFAFEYFGPGINRCVYSPETQWSCDGHF